jgi:transposase-like protein
MAAPARRPPAKRARIVLLATDGVANTRIAELVDSTVTTVLSWRNRYQSKRLAGLASEASLLHGNLATRPGTWSRYGCGLRKSG